MEAQVDQVHAVAALDDDVRRRIYSFIREQGRPVSREEVAAAVGISRNLAAFHLEKLLDRGVLKAHYARPSGRSGPGAGRPSKMYEPSADLGVSIPERRYDLIGDLLVEAIETASPKVPPRRAAVRVSRRRGLNVGRATREEEGRDGKHRRASTEVASDVLRRYGFEPDEWRYGEMVLRNCPFRSLAQAAPDLVCVMNQAFIDGVLRGIESTNISARLTRRPGVCCVSLRTEEER